MAGSLAKVIKSCGWSLNLAGAATTGRGLSQTCHISRESEWLSGPRAQISRPYTTGGKWGGHQLRWDVRADRRRVV